MRYLPPEREMMTGFKISRIAPKTEKNPAFIQEMISILFF
ncbi:hypothetical protein CTB91_03393 [Dickeya solani]|uniref:Uncharacterized protein n=1 Tax=Dickeya solani D s0432-1 TaxID=1231725 RepID=A0AAV3K7P1_9GAMM|nr:hypothetical protein D083_1586 [Dickeya solani RNS 08.23.3.1.A]AYQ49148.1 hypothetical protein CTB91_03393 [Dickeya solani]ERO56748.1 hypothetical protein A544_3321 [Dickeya solani D s0432-1]AYQ53311.1 hypothetical protein DSOL99_03390 [Dickeya solani]NUA40837.1 hypothetical protein [Dickeya solani]